MWKEIWRNKDSEWKEIFKKDNKKNLNDLLGITKTTFLALVTSLILVSVGLLTLVETANKNYRVEGRKHQNDYRSFMLKLKD